MGDTLGAEGPTDGDITELFSEEARPEQEAEPSDLPADTEITDVTEPSEIPPEPTEETAENV